MREERLAAILARLKQVSGTGDLAAVLQPETMTEVLQLEEAVGDDIDYPALYALGWLHWYRYQALPEGQDREDLGTAIQRFEPCFAIGMDHLPQPLLPALAARAIANAVSLLKEIPASEDQAMADVMALWDRILAVIPVDHPEGPMCRTVLAGTLRERFERTGVRAELEKAVVVARAAAEAAPAGHPYHAISRSVLASALRDRFELSEVLADLDDAITALKAVSEAEAQDYRGPATTADVLGITLRLRFERTGHLPDLYAAIDVFRAVAQASSRDRRASALFQLGTTLLLRYHQTRLVADLNEAIDVLETALRETPRENSDWLDHAAGLGAAWLLRYRRTGRLADADAAVDICKTSLHATPSTDPGRPSRAGALGMSLLARFERTGMLSDLEAAFTAIETALQATSGTGPDWIRWRRLLGMALLIRHERIGTRSDLDTAIQVLTGVVDAMPDGDTDQAVCMDNLGTAILARYRSEQPGALADLDAAVRLKQLAVDATHEGDPDRAGYLSNLAGALRDRFERTDDVEDLNQAIRLAQLAVKATPRDHPKLIRRASGLGVAVLTGSDRFGRRSDLDFAIKALRTAIKETATDHPDRAMHLSNLGAAMMARFKLTGSRTDLWAAVRYSQAAASATAQDDVNRATRLLNLGQVLQARSERIPAEQKSDRDASFAAFRQAAELESAPASVRIRSARSAAELTARADAPLAAELLKTAVQLLPMVAPRELHRNDQQYALGGFAGLASDAAALALARTDLDPKQRAAETLQLLEAGRAVLLSQILDTRSDLTDLRRSHPDLASRFAELRDLLDQNTGTTILGRPELVRTDSPEGQRRTAEDRRPLTNQLNTILSQIRAIDGFGTFGLPPAVDDLLAEGTQGPVVTINVSARRSDALLVHAGEITSVFLRNLTEDRLIDKLDYFHQALDVANSEHSSIQERKAAQTTLLNVLEWLWDSTAEPVLRVLGYDHTPSREQAWPRVWWATGGLIGGLPIHAAGHHSQLPVGDQEPCTVMDRVISSYIPSIRALRYARQRARSLASSAEVMIIAMPGTPGVSGGLANAKAEAEMLRNRLPQALLLIEPDSPGTAANLMPTRGNVLKHLPDHPVAHFACHSISNPDDASASLLLLHDHETAPFSVGHLTSVRLDRAQLAYLSACRTAFPGIELVDEAIHLVSAFLLAGYPHVVGTLWEVEDKRGAAIAENFYNVLVTDGGYLDASQAASALHTSVKALRDKHPRTPSLWAGSLHVGV